MTEMTIISAISQKYADALTQTAQDLGDAGFFSKQLDEVCQVINSSEDLRLILENSSVSMAKKQDIITEIFGGKIEQKLLNFLKILIEKNRINELESINQAYKNNIDKITNVRTVEITSPIELSFENKTSVLFKLEHKLNCEIKPVWKIDESLIAGLTFKFDDCIVDTSVRTKLENLSKSIIRG